VILVSAPDFNWAAKTQKINPLCRRLARSTAERNEKCRMP
jgi:hypothetical protein